MLKRAGLIEWVHRIDDGTEEELGAEELGDEELGEGELDGEEVDKKQLEEGRFEEGQLDEEQMDENQLSGSRLQWVRHAVGIWDRLGEHDIWVMMGNRILGLHLLD